MTLLECCHSGWQAGASAACEGGARKALDMFALDLILHLSGCVSFLLCSAVWGLVLFFCLATSVG